eukprot:11122004-Ditylum_brightwellii.AAC.1
MDLYPKLTNKQELTYSLIANIKEIEFEKDTTPDGKKGAEVLQELTKFVEQHYPATTDDELIVPSFQLQTGVQKYGNGINRVEAKVIIIKCMHKDTPYLKNLLNYGNETGQIPLGTFVPAGIHVFVDVAMYKGLLRQQNAYVDSIAAAPIKGITEKAVIQKIRHRGQQKALRKIFLDKN